MGAFADRARELGAAGARRALRTVPVAPGMFASDWEKRPAASIVVGLRLVSANDEEVARAQGWRRVAQFAKTEADAVEQYNDELVSWIVGRGLCDPNDTAASHPLFSFQEDEVRLAFTAPGLRYLFDAIERMAVESAPAFGLADDEDLAELAAALTAARVDGLPRAHGLRVRRFARFILDDLTA